MWINPLRTIELRIDASKEVVEDRLRTLIGADLRIEGNTIRERWQSARRRMKTRCLGGQKGDAFYVMLRLPWWFQNSFEPITKVRLQETPTGCTVRYRISSHPAILIFCFYGMAMLWYLDMDLPIAGFSFAGLFTTVLSLIMTLTHWIRAPKLDRAIRRAVEGEGIPLL